MHLSIKSALPLVLLASPLLVAASQSPAAESAQSACSLGSVNASFTPNASRDAIADVDAPAGEPILSALDSSSLIRAADDNDIESAQIVHPVASSLQVLITSSEEWTSLMNVPESTPHFQNTPRLFIENLYGIAEGSAPIDQVAVTDAQTRCNLKEDPSAEAESEESEAVDDSIPNLDPSVISPEPVAPSPSTVETEGSTVEAEPAEAETPVTETPGEEAPTESLINVPTEGLRPIPTVRPEDQPMADPTVDPNNFAPEDPAPTPFDGSSTASLESLPDGSYRYLAGIFETRAYSDAALTENGGSIFLLTKAGNQVTGHLMPRLGLTGICVTGTLSGDVITGAAYPYDTTDIEQENAREVGDDYEPYGSGALQIRQSRTAGERTYYAGALLDLSNFSRINAGTALAPTSCEVPTAEADTETDS